MLLAKKTIFFALLTGMSSAILPYSISVTNETLSLVKVKLVYAGGDVICPSPGEFELKSGESRNIESGACCSSYITMTAQNGTSYNFYPPVTGFGISCRGYKVSIKKAADGSLIGISQ